MISERDSNSDAVFYEKSVVDLTKRIRSEQSYFPPPIEMLLTKVFHSNGPRLEDMFYS